MGASPSATAEEESERSIKAVSYGRKRLFAPVAYHHAIKVQDTWFEIAGASKLASGAPNEVLQKDGSASELGVKETVRLGTTTKTWEDIDVFLAGWLIEHPTYNLHGDNCQEFGQDFAIFLCGNRVVDRLPLNDHRKWFSIVPRIMQALVVITCIGFFLRAYLMVTFPFMWWCVKFGLGAVFLSLPCVFQCGCGLLACAACYTPVLLSVSLACQVGKKIRDSLQRGYEL